MLQVLHLVNAQMETTLNTKLGSFLAAKRRLAGWTQVELMKVLSKFGHSYAATTISGWENGRPMPVDNPAFVDALAMALEISAIEIYEAAGVFSASSDVATQKLFQLLQAATPAELETIEQYAKFVIANRKRGSEQK